MCATCVRQNRVAQNFFNFLIFVYCVAVAGKSIMEHNEILGMDAALKYINQTLVDKIGDITLQVSTSEIVPI